MTAIEPQRFSDSSSGAVGLDEYLRSCKSPASLEVLSRAAGLGGRYGRCGGNTGWRGQHVERVEPFSNLLAVMETIEGIDAVVVRCDHVVAQGHCKNQMWLTEGRFDKAEDARRYMGEKDLHEATQANRTPIPRRRRTRSVIGATPARGRVLGELEGLGLGTLRIASLRIGCVEGGAARPDQTAPTTTLWALCTAIPIHALR